MLSRGTFLSQIYKFLAMNFVVWVIVVPIMTIYNFVLVDFTLHQYLIWLETGFIVNLIYAYPVTVASQKVYKIGKERGMWK